MPSAFYTDYPWPDVEIERQLLATANCTLRIASDNREETLIREVGEADTIITCWAPVTERVIAAAKNCRHIARTGIGLDNIDVPAATRAGMVVTNVPDYCKREVAEHALGLIFALGRRIGVSHLSTKQGRYSLVADLPMERLEGATLGVIGLGKIGALLAQKALALGMKVIGTNRSQQVPPGVTWRPLDVLLAESDYVSLNCPLNDSTRQLINRNTLRLMRPTAYLINTSRGGLVDHAALAEALSSGGLAGAALDVQEREPPELSQPPYNDPRVIVTPHSAFVSTLAVNELRDRVGRQVVAVLTGATPENNVN